MIKPAGNNLRPIRRYSLILILLSGIILIPVGIVSSSLFMGNTEIWKHIRESLLASYLLDTAGLALGTLLLSTVIGVMAAWAVVFFDFPAKRILSTLLALPMALPAYISAFTYSGIFDYTGPWQLFFRKTLEMKEYPVIDIMNLPGAVFIMTLALYPYIYLTVRSSFIQQTGSVYEAARILGAKGRTLFFKVSLPLARPALAGGGILVLMETLNEYGAVHYFGVNTLTVGIFRTWFSLGDLGSAKKLAAYLLIAVFAIVLSEKKLRGNTGYALPSTKPFRPEAAKGIKAALLFIVCIIPVLLGFVFPVAQLVYWAFIAGQSPFSPFYLKLLLNTVSLAAIATLLILTGATVSAHILRNRELYFRKIFSSFMTLGYAIPGTVIALGVMVALGSTDKSLNHLISWISGSNPRLFLSGSFTAIILAYFIRYLGVAFGPVDAGFNQISRGIHEASRTLGETKARTLIRVEMPNISASLAAGFILVFIDILKELPLTMILRPFNFDTLAVRAYKMAGEEQLPMAALPSLVIIGTGLISVIYLLNRNDSKRRPS